MKPSIADFLIPLYGPINAFINVEQESERNLERALSGEISNKKFILNELNGTAYVTVCCAVNMLELYYFFERIIK